MFLDMPIESTDLLSPSEVARLFGVQPQSIVRWTNAGRLTAVKTPGGHRRYRREDVDRLLAEDQAAS